MAEDYLRKIVRGSAMYFIFSLVAAGIAYLTRLLLVHNLTVEEYGLFYAVFTLILVLTIFSNFGLTTGLSKFIPEYIAKKKYSAIKTIIYGSVFIQVTIALFLVIMLWLFSSLLAQYYFESEQALWLIRVMSLYLVLTLTYSNFISIFRGFQNSFMQSLSQPVLNVFVFLLVFSSIGMGLTLYAPVIGYLGSLILFFIMFIYWIRKEFSFSKYKVINLKKENSKLLIFSLPLVVMASSSNIISYFDILMLTAYSGLAEVGIYNIIYPTAMVVKTIGSSIGTILLPLVSQFWSQNKKREITLILKLIYKYVFIVVLPIVIVLFLYAEQIILFFFGIEYIIGTVSFQILLVAILINIYTIVNHNYLTGIGKTKIVMYVFLSGAVTNIMLNFILIPQFGLNGAAFATLCSFMVMFAHSTLKIRRTVTFVIPLVSWLFVFIYSLIFVFFYFYFSHNTIFSSLILISIAGIIYFSLLVLTRIINVDEILNYIR